MRYFIVERDSYIDSQLVAAGSLISEASLHGATPGEALIEADARGVPVNAEDVQRLVALGVQVSPPTIAPVAPHAPNPTQPQALPPTTIGGAALVGNSIPAEPAEGVESREAAESRRDQLQQQLAAAEEALAAFPEADALLVAEAPQRRGAQEEPGPLDQSIPDLTAHLDTITDAAELADLRAAEVAGKSRAGALAAIDARVDALKTA